VKILYVSQYFPPEMGAPSARVSELARHWAAAGHDVTVLTGFPNHPTGVVPAPYRRALWRGTLREEINSVHVVRTWLWPLPNRKSHERIRNYASFCVSAALRGSVLARPDVVIATSPQLLAGVAGWWISRVKRTPFVLEVRDLWPESLAAVGAAGETSLLFRMLRRVAAFLYRRAAKIVVVTPAFRDRIVRDYAVAEERIAVVPNGVETDLFAPQPRVEARQRLGVDERFIICYLGTLGNAAGLEVLLDAAERLAQVAPEALVLLVGEGAEKAKLQADAQLRGLQNVRFIDQVPREHVPEILNASDVCTVLLRQSEVFETVIPTKMLEMMSCARPVVLGVAGQARALLEEARAGIAIPPGDAEALVAAVLRLRADSAAAEAMGQNGRRYIVENLSRASTAEQYLQLLSTVCDLSSRTK